MANPRIGKWTPVLILSLLSVVNVSYLSRCETTNWMGLLIPMPLTENTLLSKKNNQTGDSEDENANRVRAWRNALQENLSQKRRNNSALAESKQFFQVPPVVFPCRFTFLDFGSNVGDSLRKFIDSGLSEIDGIHPMMNMKNGIIGEDCYGCERSKAEGLMHDKWLLSSLVQQRFKGNEKPEDYCFYGIEGNPIFTSRLKELELTVIRMEPRPVRHVHFLTKHVGAGKDGPTKLYLDTVNEKDNYWGSSLLDSHVDVRKSANFESTNVTGVTLTRILPQTVLPGGHAIIKIDIEGGEYELLQEAISSNIFCKMIKEQGVSIQLLLEPHSDYIVGTTKPRIHWEQIQGEKRIKKCGVSLYIGDAG